MKENTFRPGSMGAAEEKTNKTANWVMGAVFTLLFLMTFFNFPFKTNLYTWHKAASAVAGILAVIIYVASLLTLVFWRQINAKTERDWSYYVVWFVLLAAFLLVSAGFNFVLK